MTLITYDARAHFADGVTEEAVFAELERLGLSRPLLVTDADERHPEMGQRVAAALPERTGNRSFPLHVWHDPAEMARGIAMAWEAEGADGLVAFGSAAALATARKARRRVQSGPAQGRLPPLIVLPWAEGLPDPSRSLASETGTAPANGRSTPAPSAIILDPTLTHGADRAATASGAAMALVRAVEAVLSPGFHPSGESLALGAIRRLARAVPGMSERPEAVWRRELMAASYDAHLAQTKGGGPVHALSLALAELSMPPVDLGALRGVLLPAWLERVPPPPATATDLAEALRLPSEADLAGGIRDLLAPLGLPRGLSDHGLTRAALAPAATRAAAMIDLWPRGENRAATARAVLSDAF